MRSVSYLARKLGLVFAERGMSAMRVCIGFPKVEYSIDHTTITFNAYGAINAVYCNRRK